MPGCGTGEVSTQKPSCHSKSLLTPKVPFPLDLFKYFYVLLSSYTVCLWNPIMLP